MITKIKIEGYKSIKEQELDLGSINIFIGANGVGKSNFISSFSFLKAVYNGDLNDYVLSKGGANNLLFLGKKKTDEIILGLTFENDLGKPDFMNLCFVESHDTLYVQSSIFVPETVDKTLVKFVLNDMNLGDPRVRVQRANALDKRIKDLEVYHFQDTGDKSPMKGYSKINDNVVLKKDGENIASFLYYLQEKHPKHFQRIEKTVQSIAPFFNHFDLKPNRINEDVIQLEWKEKGAPDTYFNEYNLSDGTLRFICLATLLLQPNPPKTIIIDEPELGLHPVAISKLGGMIQKIADTSQVIISTQSIDLVNLFNPEDIVVTNRENGETVFKRLKSSELSSWLEEYSLGEIWEKNIIGGLPYSM